MKRLNSGFTLIELMIVVAIIGALAAIAILQYQNYVARAQVSEAFSLASGAKTAVAEYFMLNGTFPADNGTAGLSEATDISGNYVESVTVAGGTITALFSNTEAHSKLQGKSMVLTAVDNGGSIGFSCSGTDIKAYLPSSCDVASAASGGGTSGGDADGGATAGTDADAGGNGQKWKELGFDNANDCMDDHPREDCVGKVEA